MIIMIKLQQCKLIPKKGYQKLPNVLEIKFCLMKVPTNIKKSK